MSADDHQSTFSPVGPTESTVYHRSGASALFAVTLLFLGAIVALALAVTFRTQTDRARTRDERDSLRAQLDEIQASREAQLAATACRNLYYDDIVFAYSRTIAQDHHLWAKVVTRDPAADAAALQQYRDEIAALIAEGDEQAAAIESALAAYNAYVILDPAPEDCPHPGAG